MKFNLWQFMKENKMIPEDVFKLPQIEEEVEIYERPQEKIMSPKDEPDFYAE